MYDDFNNKSAEEIVRYIAAHEPADFSEISDLIESLYPALRQDVVDLFEAELVSALSDNAKDYAKLGTLLEKAGSLTVLFNGAATEQELAAEIKGLHLVCEAHKYIVDNKGDAAHRIIKETVKAIDSLSRAEYNSSPKILKAWATGYEAGMQPPKIAPRKKAEPKWKI